MKFNELDLSNEILRGIEEMGFEEATPIQRKSIPPILSGKDIIGQAQTGTGKTAAFAIPMLEIIDQTSSDVQGLILCPTRELSIQISDEISKLGKYKSIRTLPIYGGASFDRQVKSLKKGVQIVVGTPGRLMDHMRRKTLRLDKLKIAVLDEADEMFNMGFRNDMEYILDATNQDRQTCFFSATMEKEIRVFSKRYQRNPEIIRIEHKNLIVDNIDQYYVELNDNMKTEIASRLIDIYDPKLTIVFCNTKRRVDRLVTDLKARGYSADGLHGDLKQNQRDHVMKKFTKSHIDILVATDVAARGIDVGDVDLVINYDLPQDEEYYVHRIGRTARAGKKGQAISFITSKDIGNFKNIINYTNAHIKYLEMPTISDMGQRNFSKLEKVLEERLKENKDLSANRKIVDNLMELGYMPTQICEVLIEMVLDSYMAKSHERLSQVDYGEKFSLRGAGSNNKYNKKKKNKAKSNKIFINKGSIDGVSKKDIINFIINNSNIGKNKIGEIILKRNYSFVYINHKDLKRLVNSLNGKTIKDKRARVEISNK